MSFGNNTFLGIGEPAPVPPEPEPIDCVTLGTLKWASSNLAVQLDSSMCSAYDNVTNNGVNMGKQYYYNVNSISTLNSLYTGWRVPTYDDWINLMAYCAYTYAGYHYEGGSYIDTPYGKFYPPVTIDSSTKGYNYGSMLKTTGIVWPTSSSGNTNDSGFSALPTGECWSGGTDNVGTAWYLMNDSTYGVFWIGDTIYDNNTRLMNYQYMSTDSFTVRLVKDV